MTTKWHDQSEIEPNELTLCPTTQIGRRDLPAGIPIAPNAPSLIDVLRIARTPAGDCAFCGQHHITRQHNCAILRVIAAAHLARVRDSQAHCDHDSVRWVWDIESDAQIGICTSCGYRMFGGMCEYQDYLDGQEY